MITGVFNSRLDLGQFFGLMREKKQLPVPRKSFFIKNFCVEINLNQNFERLNKQI